MNRSEVLYFPVLGVSFTDLFDWTNPSNQCQVINGTVRPYVRQKSKSGSLVTVNEVQVALFRYGQEVIAMNEKCPHMGGSLHLGDIEELPDKTLCVRCPWHSWKFDIHTGEVKRPAGRNVAATTYPVKLEDDGTILIGFDQFSPAFFNNEHF